MTRPVVDVTVTHEKTGAPVLTTTKRALNAGVRETEAAVRQYAREVAQHPYDGDRPVRVGDVYRRRWTAPGRPTLLATVAVRILP